MTACTTPTEGSMEVEIEMPEVAKHRRQILLTLAERYPAGQAPGRLGELMLRPAVTTDRPADALIGGPS